MEYIKRNFSFIFSLFLLTLIFIHPYLALLVGILFFLNVIYIGKDKIGKPEPEPTEIDYKELNAVVNGNMYMSAKEKVEYLLSPQWKSLKQERHKLDNYRCVSCGSKQNLNCHHIHYHNLGAELLEDLCSLCSRCHGELHERLGYDRGTIYQPIRLL